MDEFLPADELDETSLFFTCGEDRDGRPTVIARPCAHRSASREESILAARRCVYSYQRCIERMPPEIESATIIYDMGALSSKNLDLVFAQEVAAVFTHQFPQRLHRVIVINTHWTMNFFWLAISPLIDPVVKSKILVRSVDKLCEFVAEDHPYLQYALHVRRNPADKVPLPPRSPYVCRCMPLIEAVVEKENLGHDSEEVEESHLSRQSTAATELEGQNQETKAPFFSVHAECAAQLPKLPDCGEEVDIVVPSQRRWWLAFACDHRSQSGTSPVTEDFGFKKYPSRIVRNDLLVSL